MLMWSVSLLAIKVEDSWINYLIEFRSGSFTNALAHAIKDRVLFGVAILPGQYEKLRIVRACCYVLFKKIQ